MTLLCARPSGVFVTQCGASFRKTRVCWNKNVQSTPGAGDFAGDDARRAGEREWGQPAWVSDAYARAAARFEQKTGAAAPGTSAAASEVAGPASVDDDRGEVEIDAATWASSVRARAKAKAEADMNS